MDGTVSWTSLLAMFSTLVMSFAFPIALWLYVRRKEKKITLAVIAGALGFIVPQLLIRLPVLQLLGSHADWVYLTSTRRAFTLVFYPLTAALFETAGRLVVIGVVLRNRRSYHTALGAGIGHGGAESIGLIGQMYINNIIISIMINSGRLPDFPGMAETVTALTQTPPSLFFLAGVERVLVIPLQIALSVLLGGFIARKQWAAGILCCIGLLFAVDFGVIFMSSQRVSVWLIEGFLLLVAIASIWLVRLLKKRFSELAIPDDEAEQAVHEGY